MALRLWPLLLGVNFSFTGDGDRNGTAVGFDNYTELFDDPVFQTALRNVGLLVLLLPVAVAIPGLLADVHLPAGARTSVLPQRLLLPRRAFACDHRSDLQPVARLRRPSQRCPRDRRTGTVDWLGEPSLAIFSVVGVHIWATFGMSLVVFLAGFATLDPTLLDAARADGASTPQVIWHVIIPSLSRTIQFVFVTTMIGMLTSMFGLLFVMTSGGPGGSTYLPEYYIWIQQGQMNRPALASAASTILFLVMLVVGLAQIALLRRGLKES